MNKERTVITQQLCDHVKALLAGKLTHKKAAEFTGIGKATVDRIVAAGFNAEQYAKNTAARKEEKEKKQAEEQKQTIRYGCVYTGTCELPQTGIELTPEGPINRETIMIAREEMIKFTDDNQVPGQMEMDLLPAEEQENSNSELEQLLTAINSRMKVTDDLLERVIENQNSLLKYIAGKITLLGGTLGRMIDRIERQNDFLGQILRRIDK